MKEYAEKTVIEITPTPKDGTDWGSDKYFVTIETNPNYENIDQPIELSMGQYPESKNAITLEVDDAEQFAKAILRAVEIRRNLFLPNDKDQWTATNHFLRGWHRSKNCICREVHCIALLG